MKIFNLSNNIQILEEEYNILHTSNNYKTHNKISFLEMRKFVKNSNKNKNKRIMLYIFWLTLCNNIYNIDQILQQYNISKKEYDQFQKETMEKIKNQMNHYISNRNTYHNLCSSNLFEKLKTNDDFQEFISKNKPEFYKFTENIINHNKLDQHTMNWINTIKNIWK